MDNTFLAKAGWSVGLAGKYSLVAWLQLRGLQAQLADARQQQKEQAADKAALQARLQAANNQAIAHDAETSKLQVSSLHADICLCCHVSRVC